MAGAIVHRSEGEPDPEEFFKMLGPGHLAQMVGQAIQTCWMSLPKKRRTIDDLEKEFRRLVDRAFQNIREDESTLGR